MKRFEDFEWRKSIHDDYKTYLIHANHSRPYLVAVKGKNVMVYIVNPGIYLSNKEKIYKYHYNYLIKEYNIKKYLWVKVPKMI